MLRSLGMIGGVISSEKVNMREETYLYRGSGERASGSLEKSLYWQAPGKRM